MTTAMTKTEREAFLADVHVGVVGISAEGRGPLTVPVWYWYEPGGDLWFETQPDSRKGSLLHVGKRISLCAQNENPPYGYVSVEGPIIDIAEDDHLLHELPMAVRYLGEQGGPDYLGQQTASASEWKRYILRPERWLTMDGAKVARPATFL
jgi:uncharacterized protein